MIMIHKYIAIFVPMIFVSCENPADKTTDAKVSAAVEKAVASVSAGTKYIFTPASRVGFVGSKITGSHAGGFKSFTGHFTIADGVPVGNDHEVVIDMNSTFSDDEKLTSHLKSADFFDTEKFPKSTFDITGIEKQSEIAYVVSGNLTLHGETKNISFPATVSQNGDNVMIDAKFDIKRKDFGIVYAGKADDLIRDEVVIELKLEAKPEA